MENRCSLDEAFGTFAAFSAYLMCTFKITRTGILYIISTIVTLINGERTIQRDT